MTRRPYHLKHLPRGTVVVIKPAGEANIVCLAPTSFNVVPIPRDRLFYVVEPHLGIVVDEEVVPGGARVFQVIVNSSLWWVHNLDCWVME